MKGQEVEEPESRWQGPRNRTLMTRKNLTLSFQREVLWPLDLLIRVWLLPLNLIWTTVASSLMGPRASTTPDIWSPPWKTLLFRTWLTLILRDMEGEIGGFGILIVEMFWGSCEQQSW